MTLEGIVLESALYELMSLIFVRALQLPRTDARVHSLAHLPETSITQRLAETHSALTSTALRIQDWQGVDGATRRHSLVDDVGVTGESDLLSSGGGEASRGVETSSGQDGHGGWAV